MKKILLIEKNASIRSNLAQVLQLIDYEVLPVHDGNAAVDIMTSMTPDLIICDALLPLPEGLGLIQQIQNNPATKELKVMFYTPCFENPGILFDSNAGQNGFHKDFVEKLNQNGNSQLKDINSQLLYMNLLNGKDTTNIENGTALLDAGISKSQVCQSISEILLNDRDINYYSKKQIIYQEGNCARNLYFIKKGKIKTYQSNDYGKQLVVDLHAENDFLGYVPLIENTNYTETAEALEDTELILIPKSEFNEILKQHLEAMKLFINLLAKNVMKKNNQMVGLAYNSLRKKVAEALIVIFRKYNSENVQDFTIDINRDSLAAIAGTATESLIRTLADFKTEKLIDVKNNIIKILEVKKLESLM